MAREVGDYLLWTQHQGGAGAFPFPHYVGGRGRAFESATRLYQRAEKDGTLDKLLRNGWTIDDLGDWGLEFDNGRRRPAWRSSNSIKPRKSRAISASRDRGRRLGRPSTARAQLELNAFSVYLLAKAARVTGETRYLESARLKARLGVYPGQLTDGPRRGRWADPHNARPAYHYILVRGIAALAAALDASDPDRPAAIACLRLALMARNGDFAEKGLTNKDSVLEALLLVEERPAAPHRRAGRMPHRRRARRWRGRSGPSFARAACPLSPRVWGRFLQYEISHGE